MLGSRDCDFPNHGIDLFVSIIVKAYSYLFEESYSSCSLIDRKQVEYECWDKLADYLQLQT